MTASRAFRGSLVHAAVRVRRLLEGWTRRGPAAAASHPPARVPGVYGLLSGCTRLDD
ncbi:MAG: hypothetical protein KGL18_15995 [Burkholderiales bacterium]|nr:hypothetical protein [Burkholderiales bacterium]MDE1928669.1 hypothetical protein [Burkholderiales bacterium]MDE2159627.1 hypothetical protein [Burkholderiales bacterium]MDE2504466.1 hypothetical protein [Burkholderiales bacterium]